MTRKQFLLTILGIPAIVKAVKSIEKPKWTGWAITRNGNDIRYYRNGEEVTPEGFPIAVTNGKTLFVNNKKIKEYDGEISSVEMWGANP